MHTQMMMLFLFVVLLAVAVKEGVSQRWYYTGKFQNDNDKPLFFDGHLLDHNILFESNNFKDANISSQILYCGGLILTPSSPNATDDGHEILEEREWNFLTNITLDNTYLETTNIDSPQSSMLNQNKPSLISVSRFTLNIAKNYGEPLVENVVTDEDAAIDKISWATLNAEIGLYDGRRGVFVQREWRSLNLGTLIAVVLEDTAGLKHKIVWTTDMYSRMTLIHHTWDSKRLSSALNGQNVEIEVEGLSKNIEKQKSVAKLRVMTYNLWHNNPPSWIYGDKRQRWKRYERRIRHFAEMVVTSAPDVVNLQEVRLDSSFYSIENTISYWRNHNVTKADGGSQIEHLLSHIAAAKRRLGINTGWEYQVVYQPAMSMWERGSLATRNEEGVMILSRYPIIASKVVLLPREVGNPADDHQRIVLIAQLNIDDRLVSVASSHWSLHEPSRNMAANRIFSALKDDIFSKSSLQILTGDFNAEPHENSVKMLVYESNDSTLTKVEENDAFIDAWTMIHQDEGFTFPTCKPIKRIDFVLVRNNSDCVQQCFPSSIVDTFIVGRNPTEDTVHLIDAREGLGMNDEDSPIWASDHLAVVTDILLH